VIDYRVVTAPDMSFAAIETFESGIDCVRADLLSNGLGMVNPFGVLARFIFWAVLPCLNVRDFVSSA
jgi:hypothetical protein